MEFIRCGKVLILSGCLVGCGCCSHAEKVLSRMLLQQQTGELA